MFIYSVMLVPRLWVNPNSGSLNFKVACELSKNLYGPDQWRVLLKVK